MVLAVGTFAGLPLRGLNPNVHFLLADTAEAIARFRAEGKLVFLHCVHAQRRTPVVAAARSGAYIGGG